MSSISAEDSALDVREEIRWNSVHKADLLSSGRMVRDALEQFEDAGLWITTAVDFDDKELLPCLLSDLTEEAQRVVSCLSQTSCQAPVCLFKQNQPCLYASSLQIRTRARGMVAFPPNPTRSLPFIRSQGQCTHQDLLHLNHLYPHLRKSPQMPTSRLCSVFWKSRLQ
jgi:hypothetical protein